MSVESIVVEAPLPKSSETVPIEYQTPAARESPPRVGRAIRYGIYSAVFAVLACLFLTVLIATAFRKVNPSESRWTLVITAIVMSGVFVGFAIKAFFDMRAAWRGEDRPM